MHRLLRFALDGGEQRLAGDLVPALAELAHDPAAVEDEDAVADVGELAELSVGENLSLTVVPDYWHRGVLNRRRERRDSLGLFDSFLIKAESAEAPLRSLSGGNQQKVVLARWLRRDPRVLLLDEPTQGVDVGARRDIYAAIRASADAGKSVLVTSSEPEELVQIADRVIVLSAGRIAATLDYSDIDEARLLTLAHQVEHQGTAA